MNFPSILSTCGTNCDLQSDLVSDPGLSISYPGGLGPCHLISQKLSFRVYKV